MRNTLKNKQRLFDLYADQKVFINGMLTNFPVRLQRGWIELLADWNEDKSGLDEYLELTDLKDISDSDLIKLTELVHGDKTAAQQMKLAIQSGLVEMDFLPSRTGDFLRSNGYAFPFRGLTVKKQIEYGWIKLKSNSDEG